MSDYEMNEPSGVGLRFQCRECGYELEAPPGYAGVEGPCPVCGTLVRAPLPGETALLELPAGFWTENGTGTQGDLVTVEALSQEPEEWIGREVSAPALAGKGCAVEPVSPPAEDGPDGWTGPTPEILDSTRLVGGGLPTLLTRSREEEEAEVEAGSRRRTHRLQLFDAALILLFLGTLALGGAAVAFTQSKQEAVPPGPPELSRMVVDRMQQLDRQRDQAVQSARLTLQGLLGMADPKGAEALMMPGSAEAAGLVYPCFAGADPADFEFIQARRIPGTERFLTLFEIVAAPPLVIPVEETAAGTRVHGLALAQQQGGSFGKFLASQGQGDAVFYVLLRPAPTQMAMEFLRTRPDLQAFQLVAVEPAFPADGAAPRLLCLAPESEAAAIFAKRAHDPGLRPAVVQLAWRQHRESGNYIELVSFQPNAWSRH